MNIRRKRILLFSTFILIGSIVMLFAACSIEKKNPPSENTTEKEAANQAPFDSNETTVPEYSTSRNITSGNRAASEDKTETVSKTESSTEVNSSDNTDSSNKADSSDKTVSTKKTRISWNNKWAYASFSKIHDDPVTLCRSQSKNRKNRVIAVNAGHGTPGGNSVRTLCHPDGSPKVTGGSTAAGQTTAAAISSGMTFLDGTEEATATLSLAKIVKETLLNAGYDVLMIRETNNCRLDNIARTVYANENADCHISLHYDSSESDKGFFYIRVPDNKTYRSMEPVASHWKEHNLLGESILAGMKSQKVKIFSSGSMEIDLTQTSYSTIPSVDVEVGDRASDYSEKTQKKLADGILAGVESFFR
ncbi:MAG: N-acetylmuramoyl-L-alanine amidase [Lachnospiraceae bacterium]|nr:N-acetylmuramoyl-L-alanine amidase [Lachnospiraceae bacterium]